MFKLTIDTGNSAFQDGACEFEVARILEEIARNLARDASPGPVKIRDANGNTCGSYTLRP